MKNLVVTVIFGICSLRAFALAKYKATTSTNCTTAAGNSLACIATCANKCCSKGNSTCCAAPRLAECFTGCQLQCCYPNLTGNATSATNSTPAAVSGAVGTVSGVTGTVANATTPTATRDCWTECATTFCGKSNVCCELYKYEALLGLVKCVNNCFQCTLFDTVSGLMGAA